MDNWVNTYLWIRLGMGEGEWIWQGQRDNKFILAHAKYEMFIRHQGRAILLVAGNLSLKLGEV